MNKEFCLQAFTLRSQGTTYPDIAKQLDISVSFARHLVSVNSVIQTRPILWTEGLPASVARAVRHAGFSTKEEVLQAFLKTPERINNCLGMGQCGLMKLRKWVGLKDSITKSYECG